MARLRDSRSPTPAGSQHSSKRIRREDDRRDRDRDRDRRDYGRDQRRRSRSRSPNDVSPHKPYTQLQHFLTKHVHSAGTANGIGIGIGIETIAVASAP